VEAISQAMTAFFFYTVYSPATTLRARTQASARQRIGQSDSTQAASKTVGVSATIMVTPAPAPLAFTRRTNRERLNADCALPYRGC
jgi:hypothetical protein